MPRSERVDSARRRISQHWRSALMLCACRVWRLRAGRRVIAWVISLSVAAVMLLLSGQPSRLLRGCHPPAFGAAARRRLLLAPHVGAAADVVMIGSPRRKAGASPFQPPELRHRDAPPAGTRASYGGVCPSSLGGGAPTDGLEVRVVAPEARPMEIILGPEVGDFVREVHEQHGVAFHLDTTAASFDPNCVTLKSGEQLDSDFVVVGIGVRPQTTLAEGAGIAVDRGVAVNPYLETSIPGIWAAGDIARWPDRLTGEMLRIEHWVVAERQGQTAARNMLGARERFDAVPFFWSQQHDLQLNYVGHAAHWDRVEIDGSLAAKDCTVTYRQSGRKLAVLTIGRDCDSLAAEIELEKTIAAGS
jgi:hypothetical protein